MAWPQPVRSLIDNKPQADRDLGLTRFGWRDYDPLVGRFTVPDPLGDTGGDHDLYDYCVDDPVSMNDPTGLFPPLLIFLGIKAAALTAAAAGVYGSAAAVDLIPGSQPDAAPNSALAGVNKVAPMAAAASGASALPGLAMLGPGAAVSASRAAAALGQRAGAALEASQHGKKVTKALEFTEGFLNPNAPTGASAPAMWGMLAHEAIKEILNKRSQKIK